MSCCHWSQSFKIVNSNSGQYRALQKMKNSFLKKACNYAVMNKVAYIRPESCSIAAALQAMLDKNGNAG
jgi:hypothetical protein